MLTIIFPLINCHGGDGTEGNNVACFIFIISRLHSLSSSAHGSVPNVSMLDGGAGDQDRSMGITGMDILF